MIKVNYKPYPEKQNSDESCGICLDNLNNNDYGSVIGHNKALEKGLQCQIHEKCLKAWIEKQSKCPFCRADIKTRSLLSLKEKSINEVKLALKYASVGAVAGLYKGGFPGALAGSLAGLVAGYGVKKFAKLIKEKSLFEGILTIGTFEISIAAETRYMVLDYIRTGAQLGNIASSLGVFPDIIEGFSVGFFTLFGGVFGVGLGTFEGLSQLVLMKLLGMGSGTGSLAMFSGMLAGRAAEGTLADGPYETVVTGIVSGVNPTMIALGVIGAVGCAVAASRSPSRTLKACSVILAPVILSTIAVACGTLFGNLTRQVLG